MSYLNINTKSAMFGLIGLLALSGSSLPASAGVVLSSTRVIYEESLHEKTIKAVNRGTSPVLIQTWIDDGRENTPPDQLNVPFMVTPPVGRLDPKHEQIIKITSLNNNFPKDRESVYWLNVMEIPAKAKNTTNVNILQVAFRTRIKLFWRPDGLKGTYPEAMEKLQWKLTNDNGKYVAIASNSTPYYISLSKADVTSKGHSWKINVKMIPPFGKETLEIEKMTNLSPNAEIKYIAIGEQGNIQEFKQPAN